jgi:molybdate transport system ATP-binding protein
MHIKNLRHPNLQIDELITRPKEAWCIYGRNRSGIDAFIDLLSGELRDFCCELADIPENPGLLSFQVQQAIFEEELRKDDTDILGRLDPGTPVREFIPAADPALVRTFGMERCLDVGYRQLSSGQSRKLLLLRELTCGATTLVIQNPYEGLDQQSCAELDQALSHLPEREIELILTVNSVGDIPDWCTHLAVIGAGQLRMAGPRSRTLARLRSEQETTAAKQQAAPEHYLNGTAPTPAEELVFLQNGHAAYGDTKLFAGLNLRIHTGDHTLITGPNGCGKSTLLDIITGDNPGCYGNDLRIFGRKRGSGESIWDIKKHMGIISGALHREHRVPGSALHIILSGLYDSIGLYRKVHESEMRTGMHWLAWLGLEDRAGVPFRRLPFAEQRLVLIARALIKRPKLLIFDEATHGLDDTYRQILLDLLEKIADQRLSTILFVSHRKDEQRPFFHRIIPLETYAP